MRSSEPTIVGRAPAPGKTFLLAACLALLGAAGVGPAAQRPSGQPCQEIVTACRNAGFVEGGANKGNGLQLNCVQPLMLGTSVTGSEKPLPEVDPRLIAACKQRNPRFGRANSAQDLPPVTPPPAPPLAHAAAAGSPNIVFILTDDLAMNLVQYMPHVLQMQKDGATFANYFVTDSLCCPSRSSIFTGRYPHDTGVFKNVGNEGGYIVFKQRGNEQSSFAVSLAAAGYRTAFLGKYLNGYEPRQHSAGPGWNHWLVAGNGYAEFRYALNQDGQIVQHGFKPEDYLTDVLAADAVRFIKQKSDKPFFIEVATFAPHAPYTPAPRDANAFPGLRAPRTPAYNAPPDVAAPHWLQGHRALDQQDMDRIDQDFRKRAQSVVAVDRMIGELQAAVASIGQAQNTYVVFSSDNGYHMGEFRLMPGKMTAYDTDIHVPLVITGPTIPAGRTFDEIVENVDLNPTFNELATATTFPFVDGVSLAPIWQPRKADDWRGVALIEHHGPLNDPVDPDLPSPRSGNPTTYSAIRSRAWLYVEYGDGEKEYHDLVSDPNQLRNTFSILSNDDKAALHVALDATVHCHDAKTCWAAQRAPRLSQRR
jgi:arylsulfatase A-like enzyme